MAVKAATDWGRPVRGLSENVAAFTDFFSYALVRRARAVEHQTPKRQGSGL
ncbi:MAG TPA: hypothetical protein VF240_08385 [Pyrinomonadaceae bacterium]